MVSVLHFRLVEHAAAVILAYLLGSIGFGVVVSRFFGVDIYSVGSGNPGTSNVFRAIGKKAAGLVLAGDALKGLLAVAVADVWVGETLAFVAGFAVVVGHVFPVWHRFKGGKGVATAIGGAIWLEPSVGIILGVAWLAVVITTKTASIASLGVMAAYVPGFALAGATRTRLWWAAATASFVVVMHWENIVRLISGKEHGLEEM